MDTSQLWILLLIVTGVASLTFHTNCTLPAGQPQANYISSPNTRGTINIVWSCLATLLICTYKVLHLDVPENNTVGHSIWRNLKWSLATIFFPEVTLTVAAANLYVSWIQWRLLDSESRKQWTLTHMLFADMFGFVIHYAQPKVSRENQLLDGEKKPIPPQGRSEHSGNNRPHQPCSDGPSEGASASEQQPSPSSGEFGPNTSDDASVARAERQAEPSLPSDGNDGTGELYPHSALGKSQSAV